MDGNNVERIELKCKFVLDRGRSGDRCLSKGLTAKSPPLVDHRPFDDYSTFISFLSEDVHDDKWMTALGMFCFSVSSYFSRFSIRR